MLSKRKKHTAAFKGQVALAPIKGDKTVNERASQFGVHPTLIHSWKKQLLAGVEEVFASGIKASTSAAETLQGELFEQIGRLKMELEWLQKTGELGLEQLRTLLEVTDGELSVRRQCELLGLNRSTLYYQPATESAVKLNLMQLIDKQYTDHPFYWFPEDHSVAARALGHEVNRKRVQRLMALRGLQAIYPQPRLSVPGQGHHIYPYLLRGVRITKPDQVWSTDITYIPMPTGFMYLAAVIDWYSRYVVAWRLSNTLDSGFCLDMLDEALAWGKPQVFNTDQGTQFTAEAFTSLDSHRNLSC